MKIIMCQMNTTTMNEYLLIPEPTFEFTLQYACIPNDETFLISFLLLNL